MKHESSFLSELLQGGSDYRVTQDIGGAVFGPKGPSREERAAFSAVADKLIAYEGLGYLIQLSHRSSDDGLVDRIVINIAGRQPK